MCHIYSDNIHKKILKPYVPISWYHCIFFYHCIFSWHPTYPSHDIIVYSDTLRTHLITSHHIIVYSDTLQTHFIISLYILTPTQPGTIGAASTARSEPRTPQEIRESRAGCAIGARTTGTSRMSKRPVCRPKRPMYRRKRPVCCQKRPRYIIKQTWISWKESLLTYMPDAQLVHEPNVRPICSERPVYRRKIPINRDLDISAKRPECREQSRSWHIYAWCAIGARTQCTSHMSKETCISSTKTYVYLRKRPVCRRFWFYVKSWRGIWVCGFGGFWGCSICSGKCHDAMQHTATHCHDAIFRNYRSLLQNMVSLIGLFCKRDL